MSKENRLVHWKGGWNYKRPTEYPMLKNQVPFKDLDTIVGVKTTGLRVALVRKGRT